MPFVAGFAISKLCSFTVFRVDHKVIALFPQRRQNSLQTWTNLRPSAWPLCLHFMALLLAFLRRHCQWSAVWCRLWTWVTGGTDRRLSCWVNCCTLMWTRTASKEETFAREAWVPCRGSGVWILAEQMSNLLYEKTAYGVKSTGEYIFGEMYSCHVATVAASHRSRGSDGAGVAAWRAKSVCASYSQERSISNLPLPPHQKYFITQYEEFRFF